MSIRPLSLSLLPLAGLLALLPLSAQSASTKPLPSGTISAPPTTEQQKSMLLEMQDAFTKIAETVEPSVVNIKATRLRSTAPGGGEVPLLPIPKSKGRGSAPGPLLPSPPRMLEATGSGVIVRSDGYILTNDHVVEGATNGLVTVTLFDGREFKGKVYPDFRSDLAVVKIDPGPTPLPAASFADSSVVKPGQWAVAIGSPFDLQNTMTVGVISATGRHQQIGGETDSGGRYYPDLIQTDAAINPGNSGGPLFNIDGQVVGINVAIESPVEGSAGVGFAIPSSIAQQIMATLISQGKVVRGQLGVVPDDLTPPLQEKYGQKQGAFLHDVVLDSPADKAGLQATDIVTSYDGKPITNEVSLRAAIATTPPGKSVMIGYVRDGSPTTTTATITAAPVSPEDIAQPEAPAPASLRPTLGLEVRDLTPHDRQSLTLPATTTGVLVIGAAPGSPAEQVGLGAEGATGGVVIQKVNQVTVTSKAEFDRAAAALAPGSLVTLVAVALDPETNQFVQSAIMIPL